MYAGDAAKNTRVLSRRYGSRALLATTLACLMTACIAGTFYTEGRSSSEADTILQQNGFGTMLWFFTVPQSA